MSEECELREVSLRTLNHSFQVFELASSVLAIRLSDVQNVHGIPFEKSSEGTGRKACPHMSGQNRAAQVRFNGPGDAFLNREAKATVAVICRPFPGRRDARYDACDGTGSASSDSSYAFFERYLCANRNAFVRRTNLKRNVLRVRFEPPAFEI